MLRQFHGQRNLAGYNPWGHKESNTTERLTLSLWDGQRIKVEPRRVIMPSFLGLWGKGRAVLEFLRSSLSCRQLCFRFIRRRGKQRKTEREREILRDTENRGERNCPDASN